MQRFFALLAGAAVGLLLGLLVGLSTTPVAASVVGGVVALFGTFFGLKDDAGADEEARLERRLTVAAFGLTCAASLLVGLQLRVRDTFQVAPRERVDAWRAAGYDSSSARDIVALQIAGLVPKGVVVQAPEITPERTALRGASVQYCEQSAPGRLNDAESVRAEANHAGPLQVAYQAAAAIGDSAVRNRVIRASYGLVCPAPK